MARKAAVQTEAVDETHQALVLQDAERASREAKVSIVEGDLPYNKDVYVSQVKIFISRSLEDLIEAGKRLLVIKEKEGYGEFEKIISDEIGLPLRSAYRCMQMALFSKKFPQITSANWQKSSVYALLEAPEEDLKVLEKQGILAGNSIDDLQRMSFKEIKELVRKLKNEVNKVVAEEVKTLKTENAALIKENQRLSVFDPTNRNADWCAEQMKVIEKIVDEFDSALRKFAFDERALEDLEIQAKVEAIQSRIEKRFKFFRENWDEQVNPE